jgi:nanoRNase/pAp phosphatase (c-di-AMP/oligoRNAs hydrolase)
MAGVRNKPNSGGRFQAWYIDMYGDQQFFTGSTSSKETKRMADKLEDDHRQIRLGYRDKPKSSAKHKSKLFSEIADSY